jgi:hypothetical protein
MENHHLLSSVNQRTKGAMASTSLSNKLSDAVFPWKNPMENHMFFITIKISRKK